MLTAAPLPRLAPRRADGHKGDYGRVRIVGGSLGLSGAAALAGVACLRSGAGLVTVAVPALIQPLVAAVEPCLMTVPLPHDDAGLLVASAFDVLAPALEKLDVLSVGPGIGRSPGITELVLRLERAFAGPLVLDADALNALAAAGWTGSEGRPRVLTPHPGEFARLTGLSPAEIAADRIGTAEAYARRMEVVLILKGHRSVVTDGLHTALNTTGNPGMAVGGSGDVLTGIVAALLGQGLDPFSAARLGAHVHGLAGDLAAAELGQVGMIASDLPRFLPQAFLRLERDAPAA